MGTRLTLTAALAAALALSACDDLKLPGVSGGGTETPAETDTTPATTDTTETPTTEPIPTDGTDTTDPTPVSTDPATDPTTDPAPAREPAASLSEINAVNCLVYSTPSLTVAELMEAGPPEATVGTASVNGTRVSRSEFPGIVKLEPATDMPGGAVGHGHCGASRIADRWFITAAHCLDSAHDRIELVVGSDTLKAPTARRITALRSVCHAAYGGAAQRYSNDVALIEISPETAATLTDIPIATLGGTDLPLTPRNYRDAWVGGWGLTSFSAGTLSNDLLQAKIRLTSVGPAQIETESVAGSGPCVGDSGGPVYVEEADGARKLVGVLSSVEGNAQGKFCEGTYKARFTNLAGFTDWAADVMATCEATSALCDLPLPQ